MSAVPANELETVRDWLRWAVSRFNEAKLAFGHGSTEAYDEAAYLLLHALHLPLDRLDPFLDARLTLAERQTVAQFFARPAEERGASVAGAAALVGARGLTDEMGQLRHERGGEESEGNMLHAESPGSCNWTGEGLPVGTGPQDGSDPVLGTRRARNGSAPGASP